MKTAAAHHPIRSLARRLPAPLPLITPEANKSLEILYGQRPIGFSRGLANIEFDVSRLLRRNQIEAGVSFEVRFSDGTPSILARTVALDPATSSKLERIRGSGDGNAEYYTNNRRGTP